MYGTTLIDQKLKAELAETLSKEMKDEVKIWMFTDKRVQRLFGKTSLIRNVS